MDRRTSSKTPVDIYLIGSGIRPELHISPESVQALRVAKSLYILHGDPSVVEWVRQFCKDTRDLSSLYRGETQRSTVYKSIASEVLRQALSDPPVALLVHGHPLFLVSAVEMIISAARRNGLITLTLPGISSLDTILCDLSLDLGYGVQLFDATSLIQNNWSINPQVPLLVFQLANVCCPKVQRTPPRPRSLLPLVRFLKQWYPPKHTCYVVYSGMTVIERSIVKQVILERLLTDENLYLNQRPTLYVPSIKSSH